MQEEKDLISEKKEELADNQTPPEEAEHLVLGIKHQREPDAENIMPAEDRLGTF